MLSNWKLVAGCVGIMAGSAFAQDELYKLNPGSYYEFGCHGGCDCPVSLPEPLLGTFRLTRTSIDPLFEHFAVSNVQWSSAGRSITGSGSYRLGGEVAFTQEMTLDLSIAGIAKHVDSGLVVVQATWPRIVISMDNSAQSPLCYDTVMHIDASPVQRFCSADFDGNGDAGTDADIEAFFACIAGKCCATCASADFNGDGDFGTDADIESFFRVLAGGPC